MNGYGDRVEGDMRLVQPVLYAHHIVELPILEPVPPGREGPVSLISNVASLPFKGIDFISRIWWSYFSHNARA